MKTTATFRPNEGKISVFVVDSNRAKKIATTDRVAVYDHAGNLLVENLYADFPEIATYEKFQETNQISDDVELRLGMFFEANYQEKNAQILYLWYLKGKEKQIFLLTKSAEMSERLKQAEKERRLFHSGFDILKAKTTENNKIEIAKNVATIFQTERTCEECGKKFAASKYARNRQRFCSDKCRRKNFYRTQKR